MSEELPLTVPPEAPDENPGAGETPELSFEAALAELEKTVARMEAGKLPLEELIVCFERGSKLAAECRAKLDSLERRIEILTRDDGGEGVWSDFESESD